MNLQEIFNNRYVRLSLLTLLGAVLLFMLVKIILVLLSFDQSRFPNGLLIMICLLASGYVAYRYISNRF